MMVESSALPRSLLSSAVTIRPARIGDIHPMLDLHCDAFADKFGRAFGPDGLARGAAALAAAWQRQGQRALRGMFVAEWEQRVVGTITLRTWEMGEDDAASVEMAFQQVLGLWGATRSMFVLSLLSHRIARTEGFITDVAVASEYRRRGVATHMLRRVSEEATRLQKQYLGLYVSAANTGAIALYRKTGFYRSSLRRSWMTRLCFGQRDWVYMRRNLS
jgi:ribosomal protein S18 acetylase RimI-like enzyme